MKKIDQHIIRMMSKLKNISLLLFGVMFFFMIACEDFIEVDVQKSQITKDLVFSNDITATSAITGIYSDMYTAVTSFASGTNYSVTSLCGLSSDELVYYPESIDNNAFEQNSLTSLNVNVFNLWKSMYYTIYSANSALEGLERSTNVTSEVKNQLKGEALFIRAFSHFYLTNLFGEVPLVTTTDYHVNAKVSRLPTSEVYKQIVADLLRAQELLNDTYATPGRVRPNKSTATALLARVYLYTKDWTNATTQATAVINESKYSLESNLDDVFLENSDEAIWQLRPVGNYINTNEGNLFILMGPPATISTPFELTAILVNAFETNDPRRTQWIQSISSDDITYYYPYKYKIQSGGTASIPAVQLTEYSMVFRLAEQYLIRAEARAHQADLSGAISDLDVIRGRAMLSLIADTNPGITKDDLLLTIEHERQVELFTEWGHRWLDLKRTDRAETVLNWKPDWSSEDLLYPIPQNELNKNSKLGQQNAGY